MFVVRKRLILANYKMTIPDNILQIECDEIGIGEDLGIERINKFVKKALAPIVPKSARLITFDGFDGVGKSMLSRSLAETLAIPVVELDEHLKKKQGHFLEALKFSEILSEADEALERCGRVIVEGCLVEDALDKIGEKSEFRIYVMETIQMFSDRTLEWVQNHEALYGDKSTAELLADMEDDIRRGVQFIRLFEGREEEKEGEGGVSCLDQELVRYHRERRPHDQADLIIKMVHLN